MNREIVDRVKVQPGVNVTVEGASFPGNLNLAIEESLNFFLELTTPDGREAIARSGALSDCDELTAAVASARDWAANRVEQERAECMAATSRRSLQRQREQRAHTA